MFPITIRSNKISSNGRNWPLVVVIRKDLAYPAAVWAQEAYEAMYKANPVNLIRSLTKKGSREMEIYSHTIEAHVAEILYARNFMQYLANEAANLQKNYKAFKGMDRTDILSEMIDVSTSARRWVMKNLSKINEYK